MKRANNYVHVLQFLKIVFILANSAGPDKMPRFAAFHPYWVPTVCQNTALGIPSIIRVKDTVLYNWSGDC